MPAQDPLASRIARVLEGKHKPTYQPNLDSGDHVIVLNAARIAVTSDKLENNCVEKGPSNRCSFEENEHLGEWSYSKGRVCIFPHLMNDFNS